MDSHFVANTGPTTKGHVEYVPHSHAVNMSGRVVTDSAADPIAPTLGQIQFAQPTHAPGAGVSGNLSYEALSPDKSAVGWAVIAKTQHGRRQAPVLTLQIAGRDYSEQEARELAAAILIALDQAVSLMRPVRSE